MQSPCWMIRAKDHPVKGYDFNGQPTTLAAGQRGMVPRDEALRLAIRGHVEMLSPDGMDACARALAAPRPALTERPETVSEPPKPKSTLPFMPAPEPVKPAPKATPSVAPAPPRRGPQAKQP